MLKVSDKQVVQGLDVVRPDGTRAQFSLYTAADEELVRNTPPGGLATASLEQIAAVKTMIAIDAADGKLDFSVGRFPLERPSHTIFWSNNSAQAIMLGLMQGGRSLEINGRKVEVTQAFKSWVLSTMGLETLPSRGPVDG